jgi:uncharacterized protein (TIGR03790 family)
VASRVLILANRADPDSLLVARHYAEIRHVPLANVIALPMPAAETVSWREFVPQIWEPLMKRLMDEHWIDAIAMDLVDDVGRRKYAVNSHRIAALVVCRGVPLRISHDATLYREVKPFTARSEFRTNAASVDAELALLPQPNHPINAFVLNPLFQNEHPTAFDAAQVVIVSRLDGPTTADALALIDNAVRGERDGLLGRAYVDLSNRDPMGNRWLEATAAQLRDLGFDTDVDGAPALIPMTARFDAPVLYFGWYASDAGGVFALPGFRFPPGAIALHIHSYSAATLRSATSGWVGPMVARGVTATAGNVYEPYLQLTHRPNLLLRALSRGKMFAEAGYFALQALSWQEVLIGDPLYRPFAAPLDRQLASDADLRPYAVIRKANLLDQANHAAEAIKLLSAEQRMRPSLVVGCALGTRLEQVGRAEDVAGPFAGVQVASPVSADEWALVREAAVLCLHAGRPDKSLAFWRALLSTPSMPPEIRVPWLHEAAAVARAANDLRQADEWEREAALNAGTR